MDDREKDERSSKRTSFIVLTVIGAGVGLIAYNAFKPETSSATETRNVYKSREDCIAANTDPAQCEPANGRGGYSPGHFFGPIILPGAFGANRPFAPPAPGTRSTPAPAPVGQYSSQRGGFGGSSGGYSFGS
jgi:uncharacterized protein YgiB involved in biofilm formation